MKNQGTGSSKRKLFVWEFDVLLKFWGFCISFLFLIHWRSRMRCKLPYSILLQIRGIFVYFSEKLFVLNITWHVRSFDYLNKKIDGQVEGGLFFRSRPTVGMQKSENGSANNNFVGPKAQCCTKFSVYFQIPYFYLFFEKINKFC